MSPSAQSIIGPAQLVSLLWSYPKRWILPAVVLGVLAGLYALARPATWEASQTLIIRNEAANNQQSPGKFSHSEEMQTVQETILELVRSRGVLAAALTEIGPPADSPEAEAGWPTARDVARLRDSVKLSPPNGAEFGKTEVFYLKVRDRDRDRAEALAGAISGQLETRFQTLRDAKAQSMISELAKPVNLARADLDESTARLTKIETQVGSDLAELRILQDASSGESALRRTVTEIRNELRQAREAQKSNQELLAVLKAARADTGRLVATPNQLLESQPALKRLKDGLVDSQLRTADLRGRMSDNHPLVQAAVESEQEVAEHLHNELALAVRGIDVELQLNHDRVELLQDQLDVTTGRLGQLAALRADYSNLVAENRNRTELLKRAEQKLSDARVAQASAKAASLIGRIDEPDTGVKPVGPSRSMILLAGLAGGLMAGMGVLLLTIQPGQPALPQAAPATGPVAPNTPPPHDGTLNTAPQPPADALSFKQALQKIAHPYPTWN